jgi:hypothetical protein
MNDGKKWLIAGVLALVAGTALTALSGGPRQLLLGARASCEDVCTAAGYDESKPLRGSHCGCWNYGAILELE